jgi:hypothetical protein
MRRRPALLAVRCAVIALLVIGAACGGSDVSDAPTPSAAASAVCGRKAAPPAHYDSVVVFAFENRTWSDVGLGFGESMPYLHRLGQQCASFRDWREMDPGRDSLSQYVGQVTGALHPGVRDDCEPSRACSTEADSIFRQLRTAGRDAVNYVEGATRPCSADGNAPRHVPALYLWAEQDREHCRQQVRPLDDLEVDHLPAFAFVTPDECNDGHDCDDRTVDRWARDDIQPVLDSDAYRAGKVAVFVWYDEDRPVPNLWITPTAVQGPLDVDGAGAAATLAAWQSMLGLDCLEDACAAVDLRGPAHS